MIRISSRRKERLRKEILDFLPSLSEIYKIGIDESTSFKDFVVAYDEKVYNSLCDDSTSFASSLVSFRSSDNCLKYFSEKGDFRNVKIAISKGASDWKWGMYFAAKGGHKDLVKFFIEKGASDWNRGMFYAAKEGHKDLVEFFLSKDTTTK